LKEIGVGGPRNIFDILTSSQPFCQLFTKNDIGFYFYYEISKFVVSFQNVKNTASIDTNNSIVEKKNIGILIMIHWLKV
jgi:hypothetical protein